MNSKLFTASTEKGKLELQYKNTTDQLNKVKELEDSYEAYKLYTNIISRDGIPYEIIKEQVPIERGEIVTAGQVVKAIILNGLGFVSRALYLFPQFFEDKATEHLLGEGIEAKHLNDDTQSAL